MASALSRDVFTIRDTHARVSRPNNRLIAHSEDLGWRSLYAAIFEEAPFHASEPPVHHPSLIYHLSRPTTVARKIEGAVQNKALIGPRRLCLTPGETATEWEHSGQPEILQVYLRQTVYQAAVEEMYGCDAADAEIIPRFAINDPLLEQLAIAIANALREGTEDGLYVDSIAQMMAAHLARSHSNRSRPAKMPVAPAGISGRKMRRLLDLIEEHLDGDLSLDRLAAEVEISPLYLPRAFKTAFGQPPHQYVLSRRIERAKELLRNTSSPVADIALAVGFSSQSHLSNWFLRTVGMSPAAYRRQG